MKEVIEQIHHEIKTAYLEVVAKVQLEVDAAKETCDADDKKLQLFKLGFSKFSEEEKKMLEFEKNKKILDAKKDKLAAIRKYKIDYPLKKFIPDESLGPILDKWGLVISMPERFIGDMPEKNMDDILNFELKDKVNLYYASVSVMPRPELKSICAKVEGWLHDFREEAIRLGETKAPYEKNILNKHMDLLSMFNEEGSKELKTYFYMCRVPSNRSLLRGNETDWFNSIPDEFRNTAKLKSAYEIKWINNNAVDLPVRLVVQVSQSSMIPTFEVFPSGQSSFTTEVQSTRASGYEKIGLDKQFYIVATPDQFRIEKDEIVRGAIIVKDPMASVVTLDMKWKDDPIVLKAVEYGFIVVSAWGAEASIPGVFEDSQN